MRHAWQDVPIPPFHVDELATQVVGKGSDDRVFSGGAVLGPPLFRRVALYQAAALIDLADLHPHELRRTAASLAIAAGADVKIVRQMRGHART
jgi:integrase